MIGRPTVDADGTPAEWPDSRQRTDEMATVVECLFNATRIVAQLSAAAKQLKA